MITDIDAPVWSKYIELDENLNQHLRDDAPEDVKRAYEQHLKELETMSRNGEFMFKE